MKLHIFNDRHGFVLNLALERFTREGALEGQLFINLNDETIYKHEKVRYVRSRLSSFRDTVRSLPAIDEVLFYPFDFVAVLFLEMLEARFGKLQVSWIFWSYEFFHRPDLYEQNLGAFSKGYAKRILKSRSFLSLLRDTGKRMLSRPVFDSEMMDRNYAKVNFFYSFLPEDYNVVRLHSPSLGCEHRQFSFSSVVTLFNANLFVSPRKKNRVMVGHSASLSNNHAELIERLSALAGEHEYFIPLEYGDLEYGKLIREMASQIWKDRVSFLETRLDRDAYHQLIGDVAFAVFNFRWQEALGNILFLVWNGAKVFLREESTVYIQFRRWGMKVYSLERELTASELSEVMDDDVASVNRRIIESLFSESKVAEYWEPLLNEKR